MSDPIDHVSLITSRLATQFKDSPNIIAYLTALLNEANDLEAVLCDVAAILDVDTAIGAQLDVIGGIVGQARAFLPDIDDTEFTYDIGPGYDEGLFLEASDDVLTELSDDDYRAWIRARIASNVNNVTGEDIIEAYRYVFGDVVIEFIDGDASYTINIGKDLSLSERYLLEDTDILPRTLAVNGILGLSFNDDTFRFDTGPGYDTGLFATEI